MMAVCDEDMRQPEAWVEALVQELGRHAPQIRN